MKTTVENWKQQLYNLDVIQVIISVIGPALGAFHASNSVRQGVFLFVCGELFMTTSAMVINAYVQSVWKYPATLLASLLGGFLVREIIAYGDAESPTLVKWLMRVLRRRAGDSIGEDEA